MSGFTFKKDVAAVALIAIAASMNMSQPQWIAPVAAQAVDATSMKKANESKKVDVEADEMQVLEDQNRAIFTGNVKAVRADVTLTTDKLVVIYREKKNADGTKDTEVTNLEAMGNVRIVSPEQTITGQQAKMDVKKDLLWVSGNVTIRKKKSIIRGSKLFANLKTNVSRVEAGKKGRVRGSFSPAK